MFRAVRWGVIALGLALLASGGVSVFWQPSREVLYDLASPAGACTQLGCYFLYRLEVGATGREPVEQILVRLRSSVSAALPIAPRVEDFGKVDRPVEVTEADGIRTYALGRLAPGHRVVLTFVLRRDDRRALPPWEAMFVAVEAPGAAVKRGNPAWVTLFRVWYSIFSAF